ncbi:hypothetical protein [Streptomyces sp. VRA16 Mangrove soil]|uniref:hypothetical protein n=1 Tax=Streptomyces sp. VRA16 Mangrove soil TaxID=2817434 RepID=UPI001A9CEC86|nr:hypothetical protein [Streptomyces sp. VRA16 Mangrove soil]MBO1334060.1 hypothetical protein [Streptomyces sp. VRA16 Mangrove soil]
MEEGRPEPDDLEAETIPLHGFRVRDAGDVRDAQGSAPEMTPAAVEARLRTALKAMGPPRCYSVGPDGTLIERDGP